MKKIFICNKVIVITVMTFLLISNSIFGQDVHKEYNFLYKPKEMKSLDLALQTISRVLNDKCVNVTFRKNDDTKINYKKAIIKYKKAIVTNSGIELILRSQSIKIDFSKLFGEKDIELGRYYNLFMNERTGEKYHDTYNDWISGLKQYHFSIIKQGFGVKFPSSSYYPTCNMKLADALYTVQLKVNKNNRKSELEDFKKMVAQHQSEKNKPTMTEEQRKYVVQANFFNKQKDYEKAIALYKKALEIDPTVYPEAYFNLALLFAQIKSYSTAIYYMKKYLVLEPEAKDARIAQDKIYEWDAIINPPL